MTSKAHLQSEPQIASESERPFPKRPILDRPGLDHQRGLDTLDSRDLFGGTNEIGIMHKGSLYRLKITRQGKLILNK